MSRIPKNLYNHETGLSTGELNMKKKSNAPITVLQAVCPVVTEVPRLPGRLILSELFTLQVIHSYRRLVKRTVLQLPFKIRM